MTLDQVNRAAAALVAEENNETPAEAQERRGGRRPQYTMAPWSRGWQYGGRAPITYTVCRACGATTGAATYRDYGCWKCRQAER